VLWAAGVAAVPIGRQIASACGLQADRGGRVPVQADLSLQGHPEISVIGDLAAATSRGRPVPGVSPAAKQMGRCAAANVVARLQGRPPMDTRTSPIRLRLDRLRERWPRRRARAAGAVSRPAPVGVPARRWQGREWLSGFTGSMGTLVVTPTARCCSPTAATGCRPSASWPAPASTLEKIPPGGHRAHRLAGRPGAAGGHRGGRRPGAGPGAAQRCGRAGARPA
jgi:hypothetical protein